MTVIVSGALYDGAYYTIEDPSRLWNSNGTGSRRRDAATPPSHLAHSAPIHSFFRRTHHPSPVLRLACCSKFLHSIPLSRSPTRRPRYAYRSTISTLAVITMFALGRSVELNYSEQNVMSLGVFSYGGLRNTRRDDRGKHRWDSFRLLRVLHQNVE